jgi:TAT (twin-arginine translocation) pathway signal sequence
MKQNRRNFMKGAGAACALALTNGLPAALTRTELGATESRAMARGLTLLSIRRGTEHCLGVKNENGCSAWCKLRRFCACEHQRRLTNSVQNGTQGVRWRTLRDCGTKFREA